MNVKDKKVVVTGGTRGLGLGVVEALVAEGAKVWVVARQEDGLAAVKARLGVDTEVADIRDAAAARRIVSDVKPDILILNAGATPPMSPIDRMSWDDFNAVWNTDVQGGLYWIQAALNLPLAKGSRVLVGSSGAARQGSPLSGGYGGAKRMLWIMADYANRLSVKKDLGIRFQAIVPTQMIAGTGVGIAGSTAYAAANNITPETFLAGFGAPMPPRQYGEHVVEILADPDYDEALAIGFKGDTGITILEGVAA